MTYIIDGFYSLTTQDDFEEGEIGKSQLNDYPVKLSHRHEAGLIQAIMDHFDVEREAISLNACEDAGRVDIERHETIDGIQIKQDDKEYHYWKKGQRKLYSVIYTGSLQSVKDEEWSQ